MSGIRVSDSTYNISSLLGTNQLTLAVDGTVSANEVVVNEFIISDGSHSVTLLPQAITASNNLTLTVSNDLAINTSVLALSATSNCGITSTTQSLTFTAPSWTLNPVTPGAGLEISYPHTDAFTIAGQHSLILESISTSVTLQAPTSVIAITPTVYISPSSGDGALSYNGSGNFSINSTGNTTIASTSHIINSPLTIQQKIISSSSSASTTTTYTISNSIVQSLSVGSPTTITLFDGGTLNQIIVVTVPSDSNTTIQHNTKIFLTGTADINLTQHSVIGFICTNATPSANVWVELFRSIK